MHGGVSVPRKIAPEARSHVCTAGSQFPGQNLLTDTHRPKLTSNATVSGDRVDTDAVTPSLHLNAAAGSGRSTGLCSSRPSALGPCWP